MYVAGPENFKRDKILLIDKISSQIKLVDLKDGIYLRNHRMNLNKVSEVNNVFIIDSFDLNDNLMKLEDSSGNYKSITLNDIDILPLKCEMNR